MSRVFSMEAEGISKFWKTKVMTKRPTARTVQMEARDSSAVSLSSVLGAVVGGRRAWLFFGGGGGVSGNMGLRARRGVQGIVYR